MQTQHTNTFKAHTQEVDNAGDWYYFTNIYCEVELDQALEQYEGCPSYEEVYSEYEALYKLVLCGSQYDEYEGSDDQYDEDGNLSSNA